MKTTYLDREIDRLRNLKRLNDLTEHGKCKLEEYECIKDELEYIKKK